MKRLFLSIFCAVISVVTCSAQSWQYADQFGGTPGGSFIDSNQPFNMVVDSEDNMYLYGNYGDMTSIDGVELLHYNDSTSGAFLVKYNCDGEVDWSKVIANTEGQYESATWMEVKDDYIYVQGHIYMDPEGQIYFLDTLVDGSDLLEDYPDSSTYPWIPYKHYTYIIKMDSEGEILDYHLLSNYRDYLTDENAYGIVSADSQRRIPFHIDDQGNFYLTAYLYNYQYSNIVCDDVEITDSLLPDQTLFPQTYLLKFDNEFEFEWIRALGVSVSDETISSTNIRFTDIENDDSGNIYLSGSLSTTSAGNPDFPVYVEFDNDVFLETCMKSYRVGILLKFNPDGELLWGKQSRNFGDHSYSVFESIEIEGNEVFIGGIATQVDASDDGVGTIFGENDTLVSPSMLVAMYTGFIAKYDVNGEYQWSRGINSPEAMITNISLYEGDVYAGVYYQTRLIHADSTYMYVYPNPPYSVRGLAVCSWDFDGEEKNSLNVISSCSNNNYDMIAQQTVVSDYGNIYVTGTLDSTLVFGDYSVSGGEYSKMFVAKYGKSCPVYNYLTETFCYGDIFNGTEITESGFYEFVLPSSDPEVDSIVLLEASLFPIPSTGIADTVFCAGDEYSLQAESGSFIYEWSSGSTTDTEELNFSDVGVEEIYVTVTDFNCTAVDTILIDVIVCEMIEFAESVNLMTYPVPAQSHVIVELDQLVDVSEIQVISLSGSLMDVDFKQDQNELRLYIEHLLPGRYFIRFYVDDKMFVGSFVKQ